LASWRSTGWQSGWGRLNSTGLVTSALFLGSAVLWGNRVPPVVDGDPVVSVLGSVALGLRLLTKIWRE
jgi:hypothetical protein